MRVTPRKRLSGEERRAAILDSALAVFAGRGYHASSIDDIARQGGVSKALIYEHFSSKQQLYAELLEQHAGELFERLAAAMDEAGSTGAARLAVGLDAFYRFVEGHRVAWRMLFREANDPEMVAVLERIVAQVTGVVAALIAQDPGSRSAAGGEAVREQAIEMLAQMLVGSVQSLSNWWADHQEVPRERILEMTMDYAWLGLERLSRGDRWTQPPPAP
ncbi:MAG TPA: TetR/AcrR family transcriptional regulator [Thermoleophilaceae bacterium]|nr:TetR/AcrR family transcriptional regulator [Thermoleophilaceae bacterium]